MATRRRSFVFATLALSVIASASVAVAGKPVVQVSGCNQFIFDSIAELTNDIYCPSDLRVAITLKDSDLRMNGFTIHSAISTPSQFGVAGLVHCRGKCRIEGPGSIIGGETAITGTNQGRIFVNNVVMSDAVVVGVNVAGESKLMLNGSTIQNSAGCAYVGETIIVRNSTITANQCGIWSSAGLRVIDSTITGNIRDEGSNYGVLATRPHILRSTLSGNGVDVRSNERPSFKRSTCETSLDQTTNSPWGICSLDP